MRTSTAKAILAASLLPLFACSTSREASAPAAPPPTVADAKGENAIAPVAAAASAAPAPLAATETVAMRAVRPADAPVSAAAAPKVAASAVSEGALDRSAGAGGAIATRGRLGADGERDDSAFAAPSGAPHELLGVRRGGPAFPASSIAAGEWDDNANYREFQKWLGTESALPFRAVDVSHRRFLVVRDEAGRPVPGCKVTVTGAQEQGAVTLVTGPSGHALLFPHAEGLGNGIATATARCEGASVTRPVPLDANDGVVDLRLPAMRALARDRTIDVAFILDTTGSMSEEIASVKATIAKVAAGLGEGNAKVRIGLVEFKDRGDTFVTRVHPFSADVRGFASSIAGISAGGGGDTPESVNEGIHVALTGLDWQASSVGHFAFLVGDAPPHLDYAQDFSYAADMKTAAHTGIQIFTVAASGMDAVGQVVWRQIAEYTNASNLFVLRGGAGPQSTGAGDPRSSCGGTQQAYTSGNLDALILGKIEGELRALDADPLKIAGLGEDENTKPCDQRLVVARAGQ